MEARDAPTAPNDLRSTQTGAAESALHRLCLSDIVFAERYQGWEELGRGGSACVVRVVSRSAGEPIALKVFPHLSEDDVRRFQREVHSAQRLSSPFVVRTLSPFLRDGFAWIEMELVDGPNLRQELERRAREDAPYSFAEALAIALCVVRAVLSAHENGVIHRDVKPANVLLPGAGVSVAKLGDFGVSRVAGSTRATATGLLPGTPQFVAPEVIDGQDADTASDVYSLCLTLHLLFSSGRHALPVPEGATPAQWLRAQTAEAPTPIRRHNEALPAELEALLLRGLSKQPRTRPSAAEVLAGLVALAAPGPAVRPVAPRARWGLPVACAVGLLVGIAGTRLLAPSAGSGVSSLPWPTAAPPVTTSAAQGAVPLATPLEAGAPAAHALPVRISSLSPDSVSIENGGAAAIRGLRVVLVGESGARCSSRFDVLQAGEDMTLALGAFEPRPGDTFRLRLVEVSGRTRAGLQTSTIEARSARRPAR